MNRTFTTSNEVAALLFSGHGEDFTAMLVNIDEFVKMNDSLDNDIDPSLVQAVVNVAMAPNYSYNVVGWGALGDTIYWFDNIDSCSLSDEVKKEIKQYIVQTISKTFDIH